MRCHNESTQNGFGNYQNRCLCENQKSEIFDNYYKLSLNVFGSTLASFRKNCLVRDEKYTKTYAIFRKDISDTDSK